MKKRGQITIFIILAIILIALASAYFILLKPAKTTDDNSNTNTNPNLPHVCTAKEKNNEICTMEYIGVCGSDNKTYATGCTACATKVYSYSIGEC